MQVSDLPERLASKILVDDAGCWVWVCGLNPDGYSRVTWGRKSVNAHRVTYELLVGPIPAGLEIDHLCRVRRCVNPEHMEAVTRAVNAKRGDCGKHMGRVWAERRALRSDDA